METECVAKAQGAIRQMTGMSDNAVAAVLFALVASLVGVDLLSDVGSGVELAHAGIEGIATLVALAGSVRFYLHYRTERHEAAQWRAQAEELLQSSSEGSLQRQFEHWGLSVAEREVALLLLKGLSFKEIASVRDTSERTNREQARAVYRKARVGGRAELSAWFIEDLLGE